MVGVVGSFPQNDGINPSLIGEKPTHVIIDEIFKNLIYKDLDRDLTFAVISGNTEYVTKEFASQRFTDLTLAKELSVATVVGSIEMVRLLLSVGAKPDLIQEYIHRPVCIAARNGDVQLIEILSKEGHANLFSGSLNNAVDGRQAQSVHKLLELYPGFKLDLAFMLYKAAESGDEEKVKFLLDIGVDPDQCVGANLSDKNKLSPLSIAANKGHYSIMKLLIQEGNATIDLEDSNGFSALYHAAASGSLKTVQLLKDLGANIKTCKALIPAAETNNLAMIDFLIKFRAPVNCSNQYGRTPLFKAAINGHLEACKLLINAGADVVDFRVNHFSLLYVVKTVKPKNYKRIAQLIIKESSSSKEIYRTEKWTKLVGHATDISCVSNSLGVSIHTEGYIGTYFSKRFLKDLRAFSATSDLEPDRVLELNNLLSIDVNIASHNLERLANRCKQGKPLLISSGWSKHRVVFLVWKDKIYLCNRGLMDKKPVEIFAIDPQEFDHVSFIKKAIALRAEDQNSYLKFYQSLKSRSDPDLEDLLSLPHQTIGNCTRAAVQQAILVFLAVSSLNKDSNSERKTTIDQQKEIINSLNKFQQARYIKKYLTLPDPDFDFAYNAMDKYLNA